MLLCVCLVPCLYCTALVKEKEARSITSFSSYNYPTTTTTIPYSCHICEKDDDGDGHE